MDKDPFRAGLPMSFEVNEKGGETHRTTLLGWDKDIFVLLKHPPSLEKKPVKAGDRFLVRFLMDDNAFGFAAPVLGIQFQPGPMIFLKYPDKVETVSFRQSKRFKTNLPIKVIHSDRKTVTPAVMEDFSEHGCLLRLTGREVQTLDVGATCYVTLQILGVSMENLESIVRNRHVREGQQMLGVQFARKTTAETSALSQLTDFIERVKPGT